MTPPPPIRSEKENVIPLINVVFLLLIFFMIAGQMAQPEALAVTPPDISSEQDIASMETRLLVDEQGAIMHGDTPLELKDIPLTFKADSEEPLLVKIDKNCTRDCFLPVLRELEQAGLKQVRLVTLLAPTAANH